MKKLNLPTVCYTLLIFCCITYSTIIFSHIDTLNASSRQDLLSLEQLSQRQDTLLSKINTLSQNLDSLSLDIASYNTEIELLNDKVAKSTDFMVAYYIDKLADPLYITTYNKEYTWYIAAEELGEIGKAAIAPLFARLKTTTDDYERSLIFYSLLLASQADDVKTFAGDDYIRTYLNFNPKTHVSNTKIAFDWWETYSSYFEN